MQKRHRKIQTKKYCALIGFKCSHFIRSFHFIEVSFTLFCHLLFRWKYSFALSANQDRLYDCQRRSLNRSQISLACNEILQNVSDLNHCHYNFNFSWLSMSKWKFQCTRIQIIEWSRSLATSWIVNTKPHNELFSKLIDAVDLILYSHANILQQCRQLSYSFAKQWFRAFFHWFTLNPS